MTCINYLLFQAILLTQTNINRYMTRMNWLLFQAILLTQTDTQIHDMYELVTILSNTSHTD